MSTETSRDTGRGAGTVVRVGLDLPLEPAAAFDALVGELSLSLTRVGLRLEPGERGLVSQGRIGVGQVVSWVPGKEVVFRWTPADWEPAEETQVALRLEHIEGGTRVTLEHHGWGRLLAGTDELVGWFACQIAAPFFGAASPATFGDWLTDRLARKPSGPRSRAVYGDPLYHYPNFRVLLSELKLTPGDTLLEVGCGGGALLREALRSGCRAAGIDHSPDMVRLARENNREAAAAGRLELHHATADHLPFPDCTFTCAVMTGVLGFLPDPVGALREMRRVLRRGGRIAVLGCDPELRGTVAAPEPMASRLTFYDDDALEKLGREAGFSDVRVVRRVLEQEAREAGVPEEHLELFRGGSGARFLFATGD